jgi:starch phosphorylase
MIVSRYMVQGVDLWLNTPRWLMEASATSGMKATANGAIHMSVLDGWWDEAYRNEIGYAIGHGEEYQDLSYQDMVESNAIYKMLEKDVVPTFYDRGHDKLPRKWITLMKESIRAICPIFNSSRMICEYYEGFYRPCSETSLHLSSDNFNKARELAEWKARVREQWGTLKVMKVFAREDILDTGSVLPIQARLHLGKLKPEDVSVQIYFGRIGTAGSLEDGRTVEMEKLEKKKEGIWTFQGTVPCHTSGRHGFTVRIIPKHTNLENPLTMNLVKWA